MKVTIWARAESASTVITKFNEAHCVWLRVDGWTKIDDGSAHIHLDNDVVNDTVVLIRI